VSVLGAMVALAVPLSGCGDDTDQTREAASAGHSTWPSHEDAR
jgi:hypothetical protein